MSSTNPHTHKQYFLITNVVAKTDGEIDLHAEPWKLPYSIDDADLTFDGKPLNMLYEENRYVAEGHHVSKDSHVSGGADGQLKKSSRGRSRQKQGLK